MTYHVRELPAPFEIRTKRRQSLAFVVERDGQVEAVFASYNRARAYAARLNQLVFGAPVQAPHFGD